MGLRVHLVDGTYELFRYHFAPGQGPHPDAAGREVGATVRAVGSLFALLERGATHVGVATDHVIESFRNDLWPGYKTSAGMPAELLDQFGAYEDAVTAAGFTSWAMVELEADDALASAAAVAAADERVEQVVICSPDKDLGQCVQSTHVVQLDRRKEAVLDEDAVTAKFGVPPALIADYLALVGDAADGFPGIPGFGAKTAAAVLARYGHLEGIPLAPGSWDVPGVRNAGRLVATLAEQLPLALLFRRIATLERDAPVGAVDDWRWRGPSPRFAAVCEQLRAPHLLARAQRAARRSQG